eukprot:gene11777-18158_t
MASPDIPKEFPSTGVHINTRDMKQLRHALDDRIKAGMEMLGYAEDNWMNNWKMGLGLVAISFAIISHVIPVPFPKNRMILLSCAIGYCIFSSIMQWLISYVEKEVIYLSRPSGKDKHRIRLQTGLTPSPAEYEVNVELVRPPTVFAAFRHPKILGCVNKKVSIGKFFDERGILFTPALDD